jgi:hypothetical protein
MEWAWWQIGKWRTDAKAMLARADEFEKMITGRAPGHQLDRQAEQQPGHLQLLKRPTEPAIEPGPQQPAPEQPGEPAPQSAPVDPPVGHGQAPPAPSTPVPPAPAPASPAPTSSTMPGTGLGTGLGTGPLTPVAEEAAKAVTQGMAHLNNTRLADSRPDQQSDQRPAPEG